MNRPKPITYSGRKQSRSSRIYFLTSLQNIPVPDRLLLGMNVLKVAANGTAEEVTMRLSEDKFTLYINKQQQTTQRRSFFKSSSSASNGSEKDGTVFTANIDIGEMERIQKGQSTQQFEKAKKSVDRISNSVLRRADLIRNSSNSSATGVKSSGTSLSSSLASTQMTQQSLDPKLSFSIIFRGARTLDLMARSHNDRKVICDVLEKVLKEYKRGKTRVADDVLLLRYIWLDVDKDKTGYINVNKFGQVLQQINFTMKQRDVQTNYDKFGKVIGLDRQQRRRGLTFEQSATFLHKIKRDSWMVKPVNVIWNELFGEIMNNGKMRTTVSDKTFLEKFLHKKQGQWKNTLIDVRKLFRRLHDMEIAHTSSTDTSDLTRINKDQFEAYLLAPENDAFDPEKERFSATDMNQPLSQYWINSSHNTYLIGDQYTSHSSVEMYSNALYRGCRCLELDIWDGGKTDKGVPIPVVWHGHTMTTKILFVDIIKTIKVFLNFHPDTYPILLSFENHCSIAYQEVMADQLVRILGDSLYVPTESSLFGPLPSPEQLKGMIVIKGRRPDDTEADQYDSDRMEEDEDDCDDSSEDGTMLTTSSIGDDVVEYQYVKKGQSKPIHGVASQLARVTLLHGCKHSSWESSTRQPRHHMHSFSENKVRNKCRYKQATSWTVYNREHMSRTYPGGSRVDSSNYNPLLAWSVGCQMVALNFQTQDQFLQVNDGRFRENGNCGYVLKPSTLIACNEDKNTEENTASVRLSIRVLSGSCLPKHKGQRQGDCIDPYVKVAVYDVKNEEKEEITVRPTSVVYANGLFPIWSQEKFSFLVENWNVAVLQLSVYSKDELVALSTIPTSCLRRGIRSAKLFEETNTRSGAFDFASLLLDIKIGQIVAEI